MRTPASGWFWSVALALFCLAVAGWAFILANFGAPAWALLLAFAWMLTVGLPTSVAIAVTASFWGGVSLEAFVGTVVLVAFAFQLSVLRLLRRALLERAP